jgi:SAM-dependent methyltransferase
MPTFLHVGCAEKRKAQTTPGFNTPEWEELRLDIDPNAEPDIVGSTTDMSAVADESVDAVYSAHNIEHLYPHEVPLALAEFRRVLKPDGFAVITCPDLQSLAKLIAEDKLLEPFGQSPAGPVAPLDTLYGFRPALQRGQYYMAHRTGFTQSTLLGAIRGAGFASFASLRRPRHHDLWAIGYKSARSEAESIAVAKVYFPSPAA